MAFVPRHLPGFAESQVEVNVAGHTNIVARPGFAGVGIAEVLVNRRFVTLTEHLRSRSGIGRPTVAGADWMNRRYVGLNVPVCSPASVVKRRHGWQSRVPAENARELPSSEDCIHRLWGSIEQRPPFAKRQLPHGIGVN